MFTLSAHAHGSQVAPEFSLPTSTGGTVSLSNFKGRPVLLFFLHAYCEPCNAAAPDVVSAHAKYAEQGFSVIGVDQEEPASDVNTFLSKYAASFPVGLDANGAVFREYGVVGTPTFVFLAPDGTEQDRRQGAVDAAWIEGNVAAALASGKRY
jgi:peroxiredoxin